MLAGRLVSALAVGTGIIGGEEGTDDKLARLDRGDRATDLLDDAAVLVSHRCRLIDRLDAPVWPQVRTADAGRRNPDDGIRRRDDRGSGALLETHIARTIQNSSSHGYLLCSMSRLRLLICFHRTRAERLAEPCSPLASPSRRQDA